MKKRIFSFVPFLILLTAISCNRELDNPTQGNPEVPAVPELTFMDVSMSVGTGKMEGDDSASDTKSQVNIAVEDIFNGAALFAFNHATGNILTYNDGSPVTCSTASKNFSWQLPLDVAMDIYTVVNYNGNISGVESMLTNSSLTVSDMASLSFSCGSSAALQAMYTSSYGLPMEAVNENVTLTAGNATLSINAKRLFAKYNFYYDTSDYTSAGYTVTGLYVYGCKSNTVVPVFTEGYGQTNLSYVSTVDFGTSSDLANLQYGDSAHAVTLYFLENCQGTKSGCSSWWEVASSGLSGLNLCSYIDLGVKVTDPSGNDMNFMYWIYLGTGPGACVTDFNVTRNTSKTLKLNLKRPSNPSYQPALKALAFVDSRSTLSAAYPSDGSLYFETNLGPSEITTSVAPSTGNSSDITAAVTTYYSYNLYNETGLPYSGYITVTPNSDVTMTGTVTAGKYEGGGFSASDQRTVSFTGSGPSITYRMYDITFSNNPISIGATVTATARKQKFSNGSPTGEFSIASVTTWTANVPGVATIDGSGIITGVNAGNASFTATDTSCEPGYQSVTSGTFTVNAAVITYRMEDIVFSDNPISVGATATATARKRRYEDGAPTSSLSPASVTTWTANTPGVATINGSGVITGVSVGDATFTATDTSCEAGYQSVTSGAFTVSVSNYVTINPYEFYWDANKGGSEFAEEILVQSNMDSSLFSVWTSNASNCSDSDVTYSFNSYNNRLTVYWNSDNTSSSTRSIRIYVGYPSDVNDYAIVYQSGSSYVPTVTWRLEPSSLSFSPSSITVGDNATCTTTLIKRKYEDNVATSVTDTPSLSWDTDDSSVATVSNGIVTGTGEGSATITATDSSCESGYDSASGSISVTAPITTTYKVVTSVSPSSITVGGDATASATLYSSTNGGSTWTYAGDVTSSGFYKVSGSGGVSISGSTITGTSAGSATIRSNYSADVYEDASLSITPTTYKVVTSVSPSSITVGGDATASATLYSSTNGGSTWTYAGDVTSSGFYKVSGSGGVSISGSTITGTSAGSATIRSNYSADEYEDCSITITPADEFEWITTDITIDTDGGSETATYRSSSSDVSFSGPGLEIDAVSWDSGTGYGTVTISPNGAYPNGDTARIVTGTCGTASDNLSVTVHKPVITYSYKVVTTLADGAIEWSESTTATATRYSKTLRDGVAQTGWVDATDVTGSGFVAASGSSYVSISGSTITADGYYVGTAVIKSAYTADEYENASLVVNKQEVEIYCDVTYDDGNTEYSISMSEALPCSLQCRVSLAGLGSYSYWNFSSGTTWDNYDYPGGVRRDINSITVIQVNGASGTDYTTNTRHYTFIWTW